MRALTKIEARVAYHMLTASSQCLTSALLSQVDERGQRAKKNSV